MLYHNKLKLFSVFTTPAQQLSVCVVTSIPPLIGPKWECYIVKEVIEVDELNEVKTFAATGKHNNEGLG